MLPYTPPPSYLGSIRCSQSTYSCNFLHNIFPLLVVGKLSLNSTILGYLYAAICFLDHALISSSVVFPTASSFNIIKAFTVSPRFGSGARTTHACCTDGCLYKMDSTSVGHTLKPAALIIRFKRSTIKK